MNKPFLWGSNPATPTTNTGNYPEREKPMNAQKCDVHGLFLAFALLVFQCLKRHRNTPKSSINYTENTQ